MNSKLFVICSMVLAFFDIGCAEPYYYEGTPPYLVAVGAELQTCPTSTHMEWNNIHYAGEATSWGQAAYDYHVIHVFCVGEDRKVRGNDIDFDAVTGEKCAEWIFYDDGTREYISYRDGGRRVADKWSRENHFCDGKTHIDEDGILRMTWKVPCGRVAGS